MVSKTVSWAILVLLLVNALTLASNAQPVNAEAGTVYIRANGFVDPPTTPISTVDNVTYTFTGNINDSIVVERDNIVCDGSGYTVQGANAYGFEGVDLTGRSNVTVRNMSIEAFDYGVCLNSSSSNVVSGNSIAANNYMGIWLDYSSNNTISGNSITNNGRGIYLESSSNDNKISGNSVTNNGLGLLILSSSSNSVSGNDITANNDAGVCLVSHSNNNSISENNITVDSYNGIYLADYSNDNRISANTIANNDVGIHLVSYSDDNSISGNSITGNGLGIFVDSIQGNNRVYHNNFVDNTHQAGSVNSTNFWDDGYPSGGNYWSDYNGADANHDGIGDTPYSIDANNTDHYPLMTLYVIPEFPSFLIPPLFMLATLLAATLCRRRRINDG